MSTRSTETHLAPPEVLAEKRARYVSGLLWHIGAFLIINAFFWALDLGLGRPGVEWAYWITAFWGLALAFHLLAYLVTGRGTQEGFYRRYLAQERRRAAGGG